MFQNLDMVGCVQCQDGDLDISMKISLFIASSYSV